MILMTLEIQIFNVEINFDQSDRTYGYKIEPNYYNEGYQTLEEVFKAINKEIKLLVEDYGSLYPNYEASVPELIDFDEF
jgi:hypothetical protein